ncbi:MAG: 50S ribosomal protein L17 [Patescibacteria group bacterium]|jgi:large subunit ribosomal protein L17
MNRKLGRNPDHRDHTIRNLADSLVLYERIDTTEAKAKEVKSFVDQAIARALPNDLHAQRQTRAIFFDKNAAVKVIKELVPRYSNRKSGFVKSFRLKNRLGDNAPMMRLELMDRLVFVEEAEGAGKKEVISEEAGVKTVVTRKAKSKKTEDKPKVEDGGN